MSDDETPLTTRGVPRTRFNPLRDAPGAEKPDLAGLELNFGDLSPEDEEMTLGAPIPASEALISAVRRQISALGLADTVEGAAAVVAAEKAADATGSAAAACLHELRMAMNEIRASRPPKEASDPTEDVLSRRRERKAGA
jgi:hypothetical protein